MSQNIDGSGGTIKKSFLKGIGGVMGVIIGLAICCFVVIIIIAVSQGNNTPTKVGDSSNTSTNTTENTNTAPQIFKVGDKIKIGDTTLTVNEVADNVDSGNPYIKPADGKRYLAVNVKVDYSGSSSVYTSLLDFKLKDSDAYKYDSTYLEIKSPQLQGSDVKSGDSLRGWITFEIPNSSKGLKLIYQPGFFSTKQAIVDLGI